MGHTGDFSYVFDTGVVADRLSYILDTDVVVSIVDNIAIRRPHIRLPRVQFSSRDLLLIDNKPHWQSEVWQAITGMHSGGQDGPLRGSDELITTALGDWIIKQNPATWLVREANDGGGSWVLLRKVG